MDTDLVWTAYDSQCLRNTSSRTICIAHAGYEGSKEQGIRSNTETQKLIARPIHEYLNGSSSSSSSSSSRSSDTNASDAKALHPLDPPVRFGSTR